MRRFLTVLFIIGMLFTGWINLAEARHDVYVTKEDNWDYYVDTDSIGREGESIRCVYYMIDRAGTASNRSMEFEVYFYPDGPNSVGCTIDGRPDVCYPGSSIYEIYAFARKYLNW